MKKYLPGDLSDLAVQSRMQEWIESRSNRCYELELYNELPEEIKIVLDEWVRTSIVPDDTGKSQRSSYGLKADFFRDTGIYIFTGPMDASLQKAGYKPMNSDEKDFWYNVRYCCSKNC